MTNAIFYTLFFSLFLNVSFGSLKYSQIHRAFTRIYKGMFEATLVTVDSSGEPTIPYFNKNEMNSYINNYFKANISKYTKNYTVYTKLLNPTGNGTCKSECYRIRIRLVAEINAFYKYDRNQTFKVVSGDSL